MERHTCTYGRYIVYMYMYNIKSTVHLASVGLAQARRNYNIGNGDVLLVKKSKQ